MVHMRCWLLGQATLIGKRLKLAELQLPQVYDVLRTWPRKNLPNKTLPRHAPFARLLKVSSQNMDWTNNASCKKLVCYSGFLGGIPPKKNSGHLPCFIYQSQAGWSFVALEHARFPNETSIVSLGVFRGLGAWGKKGIFHLSFGSWSTTSQHSGSGMILLKTWHSPRLKL